MRQISGGCVRCRVIATGPKYRFTADGAYVLVTAPKCLLVFTRYRDRPVCQRWKVVEGEAPKAKRGLWSMPKPVAPWEFTGRTR